MSYAEIPDWRYWQLWLSDIAAFIGMGLTPEEARQATLERMGRGFVACSTDKDCGDYQVPQ